MKNKIFGRLTIIRQAAKRPNTRHQFWYCRCVCGNTIIADIQNLKSGHTQSCGCLRRDTSKKLNLKHGRTHSPEFISWACMRQRCRNKNNPAFKDYGGRGICIDPRWDTFQQFYTDMGPRPKPDYTLDRIDNEGPYSPENCRWAPMIVQVNNTRKNNFIMFAGRNQTLSQWAAELGIKRSTLWMRLYRCHWDVAKALGF